MTMFDFIMIPFKELFFGNADNESSPNFMIKNLTGNFFYNSFNGLIIGAIVVVIYLVVNKLNK